MSVGDHTELFHLAGQEHRGRCEQERVDTGQAVHGVEPLEEDRGAGDDLLPQLELLAQLLQVSACLAAGIYAELKLFSGILGYINRFFKLLTFQQKLLVKLTLSSSSDLMLYAPGAAVSRHV